MDYQNRAGSKKGGGGLASGGAENLHRQSRVRQLVSKGSKGVADGYLVRSESGRLECSLCRVAITNDSAYLAHRQGRKHQQSLAQIHGTTESQSGSMGYKSLAGSSLKPRQFRKIGLPKHETVKVRLVDDKSGSVRLGLLVNVKLPDTSDGIDPQYRFMSSVEQRSEKYDPKYQYLVIAAEPYNSIAIKMRAQPVDEKSIWTYFHRDTGEFYIQFLWPDAV